MGESASQRRRGPGRILVGARRRPRSFFVAALAGATIFAAVAWVGHPYAAQLLPTPGPWPITSVSNLIARSDVGRQADLALAASRTSVGREIAQQQLALHQNLALHGVGTQLYTAWNAPVTLKAINWYGFEYAPFVPDGLDKAPLDTILGMLRSFGFNAIRLTFANETVESDPLVMSGVDANPAFRGLHALDVMQRIIERSQTFGLRIILCDSRSEAGRGPELQSGLWYTNRYPASSWVADWVTLAKRFGGYSSFVGADLRNEPHTLAGEYNQNGYFTGGPIWGAFHGTYFHDRDWHYAAQTLGNTLLAIDPNLLIIVEGVQWYLDPDSNVLTGTLWGSDLVGVQYDPVVLSRPSQLVYSVHEYGPHMWQGDWFSPSSTYASLAAHWDQLWGYLLNAGAALRAPIFVGEFGTCDDYYSCVASDQGWKQGFWFKNFVTYLQRHPEVGWAYWSLNSAGPLVANERNFYSLLSPDWRHYYPLIAHGLAPLLGERDGLWKPLYAGPARNVSPVAGCKRDSSCISSNPSAAVLSPHAAPAATVTSVKVTPDVAYVPSGAANRTGDLYSPQGLPGRRPAVVLIHGNFWADGSKSMPDMTNLARALAFHGYVVFDINYRLVGQGGRFPRDIRDVKDAVGYLAENAVRLGIDPARIATVGSESGGYLAMMAAYTPNTGIFAPRHVPAAAVRVVAVGSLFALAHLPHLGGSVQDPQMLQAAAAYLRGNYQQNPLLYDQASPSAYAKSSVSTIFFAGLSDQSSPFSMTYRLFRSLSQNFRDSQLVDLAGSPHSLADLSQQERARVVSTLESFLDSHFSAAP